MTEATCSMDGCANKRFGRGWCSKHYYRWIRHGSTETVKSPARNGRSAGNLEDRFWSKVKKTDGCWEWQAALSEDGYGRFYTKTSTGKAAVSKAHRMAYELSVGPIPDGLQIDHKCHNPRCVNPKHLRTATHKQNQENLRGARSASTSGYRGVTWGYWGRGWTARVTHDGKRYRVPGMFSDPKEAAEAARKLRLSLHTYNEADRST
jgi:hypothetical protein